MRVFLGEAAYDFDPFGTAWKDMAPDEAEAAFAAARRLRPRDPALEGGLDAALARLLPTISPPSH